MIHPFNLSHLPTLAEVGGKGFPLIKMPHDVWSVSQLLMVLYANTPCKKDIYYPSKSSCMTRPSNQTTQIVAH